MPTFARVKNNVVEEIYVGATVKGKFHPSIIWIEVSEHVQVGWVRVDNRFVPPTSQGNVEQDITIQRILESRENATERRQDIERRQDAARQDANRRPDDVARRPDDVGRQ